MYVLVYVYVKNWTRSDEVRNNLGPSGSARGDCDQTPSLFLLQLGRMDNTDWDSVLQFVADPLDLDYVEKPGIRTYLPSRTFQVPTPPVSIYLLFL